MKSYRMIVSLAVVLAWGFGATAMAGTVGIWHFDGSGTNEMDVKSEFSYFSDSDFVVDVKKVGTHSLSVDEAPSADVGALIDLGENIDLNGDTTFGIAFWICRTEEETQWGSVLGFEGGMAVKHYGGASTDWYYLSNPGFVNLGNPWDQRITLPLNTWTHVAITADGQEGRVFVNNSLPSYNHAAQTSLGLNANGLLYLGTSDPWASFVGCHIDELIISDEACGATWVNDIYNATVGGQNYPDDFNACADVAKAGKIMLGDINADCLIDLQDFSTLVNSWMMVNQFGPGRAGEMLNIRMENPDWTLQAGQVEERYFVVNEKPIIGAFVAQRKFRTAADAATIVDSLAQHHCNTAIIRMANMLVDDGPTRRFIDMAHGKGLFVYAISPIHGPVGKELLDEHPEIAMVDQYGQPLDYPCLKSTEYAQYLSETYTSSTYTEMGIDGFVIDEPAFPDYSMAYNYGRLGCYCSTCQAAYQAMYGQAMPVINLPSDYGTTAFNNVIAFRQSVFTDWIDNFTSILKTAAGDIPIQIVFCPDVVSSSTKGYLTIAEACSVDVDDIISVRGINTIGSDPYWNAWGQLPSWYANYIPQFCDAPHAQMKGSWFWMQAYLETPDQVSRGIHAGEVTTAIQNSVGLGADAALIWAYDGFSQEIYTWDDYFDEFAEAMEPYLIRVSEYVTVSLDDPTSASSFDVTQVSPGRYRLRINAVSSSIGSNLVVTFQNALGVKRNLTFDVQ